MISETTAQTVYPAPRPFPYGAFVPVGLALALYAGVLGVVSVFRVGSDLGALGNSVIQSQAGPCDKRFGLSVGFITTTALRAGAHFLELPEEARTALSAVHGAEVSLYHVARKPRSQDLAGALRASDKEMTRRGWTRVVGVVEDGTLVGVYMPDKLGKTGRVRCCVVVLHEHEMVLVSAKADLEPILALLESKSGGEFSLGLDQFALR